MKINNKLVKHYIQYDISMLTEQEREELAKVVENKTVASHLCEGIIKANFQENSRWLACMTRTTNQASIKTILIQDNG